MVNVIEFVKNYIPLCVCTLGIAILGYLGYHAIRWIIDKCCKTEKIDRVAQKIIANPVIHTDPVNLAKEHWWTKISQSKALTEFKENWKNLAVKDAREKEAKKLQDSYEKANLTAQYDQIGTTNQSIYGAPLGKVWNLPNDFGMWLPGVALVASYLAQRKK